MSIRSARWFRRLSVQLWLWAVLPFTLVLIATLFTGVTSHQHAMRDFVAERDHALARLYARQIEDGLSNGTVAADGQGLGRLMGDARLGRRGVAYVLDAAGKVLAHPDPSMVGRDLGLVPALHAAFDAPVGHSTGALADGTPTLVSFSLVGGVNWHVLVEEPTSDVITPILRLSGLAPVLVAVAGLLSAVVILGSYRTLVRPLRRLALAASRIGDGTAGELGAPVGGVEEIEELRSSLFGMVSRVQHYQAALRDYAEGVTQAQEAERSRLSRELHDDTVQSLIAVQHRAQLAQRAMDRGDTQAAREALVDARATCERTLEELRRMIRSMRPVGLEDLGLVPALEMLLHERGAEGPQIELHVLGPVSRLEGDPELAAYRIAQEALSNAIHHSGARSIEMTVSFDADQLKLVVADDGCGFVVPDDPDVLTRDGHLGLVGMRERAALVGGRVKVESASGMGTRVTAVIPHGKGTAPA